jgi:capsular polysaccharide biosynthesis protein
MELLEYLQIIKKKIWIIVAITAAAIVVSGVLSFFIMDPVYEEGPNL